MEREGGAVALLPRFKVAEEPADVGEQQIADLGLLLERGLDLRKRVLQVPVLVGKRKRAWICLRLAAFLPSPRNRYASKAIGKGRLRGSKFAAAAQASSALQVR